VRVIGFEEHYKLPAISEEHRNQGSTSAIDLLRAAGYGGAGPQGEWPPGIYDLGAGRIAAMDAAGIDVQILSHSVPGPETLKPSASIPTGSAASPRCRCAPRRRPRPNSIAPCASAASSGR